MPTTRPLKIWLLKAGEPLPFKSNDVLLRTGRLAMELRARNHDVTWWTSAWDHRNKVWVEGPESEILPNGLRLVKLRGLGYSKNISLKRFRDHRKIAARFKELAPTMSPPDVIIASLPPYDSAFEAVEYGNSIGVPVIVDLRDEWPDLFLDRVPSFLRPLGRTILNKEFQLATSAIKGATALTSMMNGMLNWGLAKAKRNRSPNDRIFFLGADKAKPITEAPSKKLMALKAKVSTSVVVTYVGTFGIYADPRYLLSAARELPNVEFVFAGTGPLLSEMQSQAADLKNVTFTGWLGKDEMRELMQLTHFGVCPNTSYREALPNKALSFFAESKPVICFLQGEIERIIRDENIGACFGPSDSSALVKYLKNFDVKCESYISMTQRVQKIFGELFDAAKIYSEFADYVESMAVTYQTPRPVEVQI